MSNDLRAWTPLKRELAIQSSVDHIHQVENFIEEIRNELDFKEDVYGNVMVAVTEAVNNGIIHGNKGDATRKVFISFEQKKQFVLSVKVEDQGDGFQPDHLSDPTSPENLEKPGGRGVFLMRHLSDELHFSKGGREVEMVFHI
jgi:serine/threonine-protein kinase RsbW